ncbi:MAG: HEPN domain-containing protein [Oscillospiraceae bacterium]|nr:HEPN domain-containing protein [Oscillospiraceae bacterium]
MDKQEVWSWFDFADSDLEAAEHLLTLYRPRLEIICYHCQQAAEKYLKGYLIYRGIFPSKTHDLDSLCKKCFEFNPAFQEILHECVVLSDYGVQPRYPNELHIEEHHMKKALEYARRIKNFAPLQTVRREVR